VPGQVPLSGTNLCLPNGGGVTVPGMTQQPLRDLDDVSSFKLSEQGRERLFELTNECIVCWTSLHHGPAGLR